MRGKIIPVTILILSFLFYLFGLVFGGFDFIQTNIISGLILSLSTLLLPALISKVILKKEHFGFGYLIGTLIYPLIYGLAYILNKQWGIDVRVIYVIFSSLILFSSMYLFLIEIYKADIHEAKQLSKAVITILTIITLVLGTRYLLGLKPSSALSLDFLQHNAVSMQIADGELCLTPNNCSSLFKKLGYTTYFHTIQTVLTVGFNLDLGIAETVFNTSFIVVIALSIFTFFQKHFQDDETSFIAALASILFFEIGAYSFNFFLPQSFALLLFINLLAEKRFTWSKLLIGGVPLLLSHFIFGPFFFGILVIYQIFFNEDIKKKEISLGQTITVIAFIGIIITFVANLRGFSVEKVIQKEDIEQLGFFTNLYYPDNLKFLLKQYGVLILPFIISSIFHFIIKNKSITVLFSITYVSICLIFYFLGPTYANKFLIGSSIFMVFTITSLLQELNYPRFIKFSLLLVLLASVIPPYLLSYHNYIPFYKQADSKVSSIVDEDAELVEFLNEHKLDCQIVSDPYTQLVVSSQTSYDTAGGQYQELYTRKSLIEFIDNPSESNYENLLMSTDIRRPFCLLLSGRLYSKDMYLNPDNTPWLNSMYEYEIDNSYPIGDISDIVSFLKRKGLVTYYTDNNFRLFIPKDIE
jgi:hypothetical protein